MGVRLAMVAEWYPPATGGLEEAARRIARLTVALGLTVEVLTPEPRSLPPGQRTETGADGVTVTRVRPGADIPIRQAMAAALVDRGPFDGVLVFGLRHFGGLAVRQAERWGVPSVVCGRGADVMRDIFVWESVGGVMAAIRGGTRATAVTAEMARLMASLRSDGQVAYWPNTADVAHFAPVAAPDRLAWGLPASNPLIGYVGILRRSKGSDVLFEAFAHLHRQRPETRLVVVGEIRNDAQAYLQAWRQRQPDAAAALQVVPYVTQDVLPALIGCLDQVWLPSINDGFSNGLIQCMACEVPVLATPAGASPDVIRHGENGLLVPAGDVDAWTSAGLSLLDDPDGCRRLAIAGRRTVAATYTPEAEHQRVSSCFRDLGWLP